MGRYRKVDTRIWNDAKFRSLTDDGKLVFLFILTHPGLTSLGAMRATVQGLAAEIGWTLERFREAFTEGFQLGLVEIDEIACILSLPRFLRYNAPESPNVVRSWGAIADLLPEGRLKETVIVRAREVIGDMGVGFAKAFGEAFPKAFGEALRKAMPYPEPEPEPEPEPFNVNCSSSSSSLGAGGCGGKDDDDGGGTISWARAEEIAVDVSRNIRKPIPGRGKYRRIAFQVAMLSQTTFDSAWLADAVEETRRKCPKDSWAYLFGCLRTGADKRGKDLEQILVGLQAPEALLTVNSRGDEKLPAKHADDRNEADKRYKTAEEREQFRRNMLAGIGGVVREGAQ